MHGTINVISPNNISKWEMEINSAFKGLMKEKISYVYIKIKQCLYKDKAIQLQAWTDPEVSRSLKLPDFKTIGT
jgi:hypothetical protein